MERLKELYELVSSYGTKCGKFDNNQRSMVMALCSKYNELTKNTITCKICQVAGIVEVTRRYLNGNGLI